MVICEVASCELRLVMVLAIPINENRGMKCIDDEGASVAGKSVAS